MEGLRRRLGNNSAIALDIPLGLQDVAERGGRGCDRESRRILSSAKRNAQKKKKKMKQLVGSSSIFTPPSRAALDVHVHGGSHAQVSEANRRSSHEMHQGKEQDMSGLGLSIQTYHIMPKIKEADDYWFACSSRPKRKSNSDDFATIFECHPELAFLSLSLVGTQNFDPRSKSLFTTSALYTKKSMEGRRQRLDFLHIKAGLDIAKLLCLTKGGTELAITSQKVAIEQLCLKATWRIRRWSLQDTTWISVAADDVIDAIACSNSCRRFVHQEAIAIEEGDNGRKHDCRGIPIAIFV